MSGKRRTGIRRLRARDAMKGTDMEKQGEPGKKTRRRIPLLLVILLVLAVDGLAVCFIKKNPAEQAVGISSVMHSGSGAPESGQEPKSLSLEEYLETTGEEWFLTGKKEYRVQGMMVSGERSFHNDLEGNDFTAADDGETVVLRGTVGELWPSPLTKVAATYTRPDGGAVSGEDFAERDVFIDLSTITSPGRKYAMFIPEDVSVTVVTSDGNVLRSNLPEAQHGGGDYLVCSIDGDGGPDLLDVWILNGAVFPNCYDMPE